MISGFQISNLKYRFWTRVPQFALALGVLASPGAAFAQMCPACYKNAAAQTPGLLQALRTGILVMMFPSLLMFIVIFAVVFRRRNSFNAESDEETIPLRDVKDGMDPDGAAAWNA